VTTIQAQLPESLAAEATVAGLFEPEAFESLVRSALRSRAMASLLAATAQMAAQPGAPQSPEQIAAEVKAERRRVAGTAPR